MKDGIIPLRTCHNDTKINNILFNEETANVRCIVDLDTTMPGAAIHDFGDLVRTGCSDSPENDTDLDNLTFDVGRFEALVDGYLSEAQFLNDTEIASLPMAGMLMTFEVGMRFLTDYLEGDHYFKIHQPHENLIRARRQFAFVQLMEEIEPQLDAIVESAVERSGKREFAECF